MTVTLVQDRGEIGRKRNGTTFMQIAGNWRLREQRYRLQGFRQRDGKMGLQRRRQIMIARQEPMPARSPQHQLLAAG